MFFKKSHGKSGKVPLEEIKKMSGAGMAEREIIQNLKSKGYSLEEIEKGMMQAVKYGISGEEFPTTPMAGTEKIEAIPEFMETEKPFSMQDVYGSSDEGQPMMTQMEARQDEIPDELMMPDMPAEEVQEPNIMLEELVEGLMDEKWKKFDDTVEKFRDELATVKAEMKTARAQPQAQEAPKEMENKVSDISNRIEDLDIRISGLEKAFKQFLPSLTRNIEELSGMVHELRGKKGFAPEYQ